MKLLILGAGGMAGHMMVLRLTELGYDVVGLARRKLSFCENIVADITDEKVLKDILCREHYDVIVNAVGILPKSINENPANGIWINAYFPHFLAEITADTKTKIIHLSTDCVFSGHDKGSYRESDLPTARDYYGRSKTLGELNDRKNLTFRTSIVGPDINKNGVGLFHWFMKQDEQVNGFTNVIWTGVTTLTLANAVHAAIKDNLTGLYHLVNNQVINKYELLKLFNGLRKRPVEIIPMDDFVADKSLLNTRIDFHFIAPSYSEMVSEMGAWIAVHKELYHYD